MEKRGEIFFLKRLKEEPSTVSRWRGNIDRQLTLNEAQPAVDVTSQSPGSITITDTDTHTHTQTKPITLLPIPYNTYNTESFKYSKLYYSPFINNTEHQTKNRKRSSTATILLYSQMTFKNIIFNTLTHIHNIQHQFLPTASLARNFF